MLGHVPSDRNSALSPNNPKMTQSSSDLQLFIGKNMFLEKKAQFFLRIKQSTSVLVQTQKTCFLQNFAANFVLSFRFLTQKMLKMTISTSVWSAHHPNAGQNIQQL